MTARLADTPVLETERLILRAPKPDDWPVWHAFAVTERAQYIGGPFTLSTAWRGFCHIAGMWAVLGFGSFVITRRGDDTALGMTGPWAPADWPENELGWTVWAPENEGTGLAYEAAKAGRAYAYNTLGWSTAVSYIDPENARSIALAERLGAVRDDEAARPHPEDLVYRHPAPETVQ